MQKLTICLYISVNNISMETIIDKCATTEYADSKSNKILETDDLSSKVIQYISENKPSLKILTPCFGGICHIGYVRSLMATTELFKSLNFPIDIHFCKNDSLVSRARNNLVAVAMNDPSTTHIMFIDNDISWQPIDILKLILSDKPLIGGVYPLKNYNWNKLRNDPSNPHNTNVVDGWITSKNNSTLEFVPDDKLIQAKMLQYNVNYINNVLEISDSIAEVKHIATGFMMIQRTVIEQMSAVFASAKYTDDVGFLSGTQHDFAYALFDCGVEDGHYFSEDWLFCHRWSNMKGKIYIHIAIDLVHTGVEDYSGSYMSSILT